ncbi:MAG: hemerythrin domain-containing protein [Rhodobacter sp.]|jgi:hypothetical protein|nr:hemerythrin domain-containing protein [Rhodobacter sp.]
MNDLTTRTGLPEHLRVLAELYPRTGWESHGNFNDLTRFWLDRHLMFRDVIAKLQTETMGFLDQPTDRYGAILQRYTGFFLNQLHSHHGIEDQHYFPALIALDARIAPGFELLDGDHKALDGHINGLAERTNAVLAALNQGQAAKTEADALLTAQQAFERFLNRHLSDEEELVVPLILEYGPPDL